MEIPAGGAYLITWKFQGGKAYLHGNSRGCTFSEWKFQVGHNIDCMGIPGVGCISTRLNTQKPDFQSLTGIRQNFLGECKDLDGISNGVI